MATLQPNSPSSWREWTIEQAPERVRLLASDANDTRYGVLDVPRLVPGTTSPRFSLVLFLSRTPVAGQDSIRPLLVSSYLGMELDYSLPAAAAGQLRAQPLFARQAQLSLHSPAGGAIVVATLGTLLRGALHTHLGRDETLAVLDALAGTPTALELRAHIEFRASAPASSFPLDLRAAELWDKLKSTAVDGALSEEAFRRVFDELHLPAEAFPPFRHLCSCLLVPGTDRAVLGRRPAASSVRLAEVWRRDVSRHLDLACPLDAVLGNALTPAGRAACIRVVGPSGDLDGGPFLENLERATSRAARGSLGMGAMVAGNKIQTVAATLQPSAQPAATSHLIATQAIRIQEPSAVGAVSHYVLPQAVFLTPPIVAASLPVVGDLNAPLLADKNDPKLRWYLPTITLVRPAPNEAPDTSPFLFDVERVGSSASGRPAIRATLRFTLELSRSAAAAASLAADSTLKGRMIEPVEPSVSLSVPYIDETSGTLKRASYRGVTTRSGNRLQVTVELLNDAARTTYGSLSTPGFQSEPARLEVGFQFSGYAPVFNPPLELGGKISHAVLLQKSRDDAESIPVSVGGREVVFRPGAANLIAQNPTLAGRLTASNAALAVSSMIRYAQRTTIRHQLLDVFFPCAELGAFYREKQAAATVSIGCAEAYRLGQASSRTYQEMVELNHPSYRVFRNLQQPGRFLLLPRAYEITRYAPGVPDREYDPALIVYAALDANRPENNRVRFEAMLGPALSPYEYENLRRRLLAEAQSPVVELPNMLAQHTEFRWNVTSTPPVEAVTSATPECLHTALATDLASAFLLKTVIQNTGLTGEARFTFEDGSVLTSALSVHLGRITGPWPAGPLAMQRNGATLQLTNRVEASLAVKDVYLFNGQDEPRRVPVERSLAPAASLDLAAPGTYTTAQADVVTLAGGNPTLEEVRAMIEEIQCNVVFVDLVNYENYGLTRLDIDARLRNVPGVSRVAMENRRGSVDFLLPLTTYLAARIVEFRVTKVFASKPAEVTAWLNWDTEARSNIVSLTWEQIPT
jgi:hypothetical protein